MKFLYSKWVVSLLSVLFFACGPTRTINCPPEFTVYRKINKAYPVYARDFEFKLSNALNTAQQIEDTISISLKSNVVKLRQDLNNISSRVEGLTKSNLMAYFGGICDADVRKRFSEFQIRLADLTLKLTQIEAKLGQSKGLGGDMNAKLEDALKITTDMSASLQEGL